ncbi:MAG: hypothetical protein COW42_16475 [Deltaproteobacteria bacterium CG17_big_fil_post_rev_8_21_14_2_50_63_7]|nr:MAG: hypothetical protein COW42_16475 [Deltaproteobacteria bacterium CG17_big_fil_post_rev_8_21_14_2_50_63_7]
MGRAAFELKDGDPPSGTTGSTSKDYVGSNGDQNLQDWEEEWEAPVTLDDPLTTKGYPKATWFRFDSERRKNWIGLGIVLLLCSLLYIPFVGSFGLWDPWETHYGEVSRHMTETQDWISPWWGSHWHRPDAGAEGAGFYSKPILVLWSMAIGMEIWGWNEFAIRIGVALMAIFGVALTFLMGANVWNRRVGYFMATVMATSPFYFFLSRQTQTDMPFVAMMLCAMAFFIMGAFGRDRRKPADAVHYGLVLGTTLALMLPQLYLIGVDQGFDETQRAARPGLRAVSMNDFKGQRVFEDVVMVSSPKLSPAEREGLAELSPQEAGARIEASRSKLPDFLLELAAPLFVTALAVLGIFALLYLGIRGRLKDRLLSRRSNRFPALLLMALALLSQFMALGLQVKRLFDAYGMNWESNYGAVFNLVKFSGVALSLVLIGSTVLMIQRLKKLWAAEDGKKGDAELNRSMKIFAGLTGLATLVLVLSPVFLVMKAKALGFDGMSFWDDEAFPPLRFVKIILNSVYAPILLGLFLALAAWLLLSAKSKFWDERNSLVIWSTFVLLLSAIFLCVSVFYIPISMEGQLSTFGRVAGRFVGGVFQWGPVQVVIYLLFFAIMAISLVASKRKTVGQMNFLGFYIFAALATLAKGLLGFALPGAIILIYLISTVEWRRLSEFEIPRGILTFICVGFPWYAAMLILHENAYFQRFFVHDHFKRLASGVHQIDSGTFEHFVRWLGYGLFPWAALLPAVILRFGMGRGVLLRDDKSRATLMLGIWAVFAFALFSLSSTKFHHYAFPIVPPLAALVGLLLCDIFQGQMKRLAPAMVMGVAFLVLIGWDVSNDPQVWKNLFTYKYDREWIDRIPEFTANLFGHPTVVGGAELQAEFQSFAIWVGVASFVGIVLIWFTRRWLRRTGVVVLVGASIALTVWGLNVYMPGISPTWSQKGVWMSYWDTCTRTEAPPDADPKKIWCEESSLVYRVTWRGEHYYSQNEAIPIGSDDDLKYFASANGETPFYFMADRARYCLGSDMSPNFGDDCKGTGSLVGEVRKYFGGSKFDHELVWDDNLKFIMVKFYPAGKPGAEAEVPAEKGGALTPKKNPLKRPIPGRATPGEGVIAPNVDGALPPAAVSPNGTRRPAMSRPVKPIPSEGSSFPSEAAPPP